MRSPCYIIINLVVVDLSLHGLRGDRLLAQLLVELLRGGVEVGQLWRSAQHHVDGGAASDVALALHAAGAEGQQRPHAGHLLVAGAGAAGVHAALLVDALAAAGNLMSSNTSTIRVSKLNMASTVAINKEAQKE